MTGPHIAPVVLIPHRLDPTDWLAAAHQLAQLTDQHPHLPLSVRLPGAGIEYLRLTEPELLASLVETQIDWLAGGWADPVLTDLPPRAAQAQIDREATAMNAAGIVPTGLWVGDTWEPCLIEFSVENGFTLLFADIGVLFERPDRPHVVERAGTVVFVIGVGAPPSETRSSDETEDGLMAVSVAANELGTLIDRAPRLIRPPDYLSSHPTQTIKTTIATSGFARSPETDLFYRKVLRITRDQGDRKTALDSVLRLQSREFVAEDARPPESWVDLIEARKEVDRLNYRGDSWVAVDEADWDADGFDEIVVETAHASLVVDPHLGTIPAWDDKIDNWAVTAVSPCAPMVLIRRMADDNTELDAEPMVVEEISQGRSEVTIRLHSETVPSCQMRLVERSIELELTISNISTALRIGPEIPLGLDPSGAEIRVDGSEWLPLGDPAGFTGHRFRLRDESRTILMSAPRPAQLFVRPLPDHGVVVWPHWSTLGGATYQMTVTPD